MANQERERSPKYIIRNSLVALLFGLATISIIYMFINDEELVPTLQYLPWWIFILGSVIFSLVYLVGAFRSKLLLTITGVKVKFRYIFRNEVLGWLFHYITPFSMGGQPFKIYDLGKRGINVINATSTILSRFINHMVVTAIISIVSYLRFSQIFFSLGATGSVFFTGLTISILITILIIIFTISDRIKKRFFKILHLGFVKKLFGLAHQSPEEIKGNINKKIQEFKSSINSLWKKNFLGVLLDAFLNLVELAIQAFVLYLFLRFLIPESLIHPAFIDVFLVHIIMNFIVFYVPTPGASGAIEISYFAVLTSSFFYISNAPNTAILAAITAWRISINYIPIILGVIATFFGKGTAIKETPTKSNKISISTKTKNESKETPN